MFVVVCVFFATQAGAQNKVGLRIVYKDSVNKIPYKHSVSKLYSTQAEATAAVQNLLSYYYKQGFLAASIDSLGGDSTQVVVYFYIGEKYRYLNLHKGNLDSYLLSEVGFKEKYFADRTFKYEEIIKLSEKLMSYCENNGYPFASFRLDSVWIGDNTVDAAINFTKNNKIIVDSLVLKGGCKIARGYIYNYIGIKPGRLYDESAIAKINSRLRELPFANLIKPSEVMFTDHDAKIFLYLDKKKASKFYGILGILPNNQTTGKILINGELKLSLLNAFGHGEFIDLDWRSISKGTQDLKLNLAYPYLFGTPFGLNYKFTLYKKDTSYLTVDHNIGVQYFFNGQNHVKAFADIYKSNLLSSAGFETITVLPDFADVSANLFGVEVNFEKYDYKPNPVRGHQLFFSGAGGVKHIKKNSAINEVLYDSIQLKSNQFRLILNANLFVPLFKKTTLLLNTENGYIINNTIFDNELFKLGGLRSLRGFDEESLRASYYNMFLFEMRYLFEKNSFFALFFNGAYYERNTQKAFVHDLPYGFGAGVQFDTKIGIFSLYYALGSQFGQTISFKQAKIHFGFTNSF